jgi:peptidase M28-like protein
MRLLCLSWLVLTTPVAGQAALAQAGAVETITPRDIIRRVGIIADDSMLGRDTPSPGLELTAQYVASEFKRAGLRPAGGNGSYLQRFGLTRWVIDTSRSVITLSAAGARASARVGRDARYLDGAIPGDLLRGSVVLIAGSPAQAGDVRDRVVLLIVDYSRPLPAWLGQEVYRLAESGPKAVLLLSNRDSTTFGDRLRAASVPRLSRDSAGVAKAVAPILEIGERALGPVLTSAGVDLERLRSQSKGERRIVDRLTVEVRLARTILSRAEVPNVVGVLEGSDSALRREYVVYSAHIDHIGVSPGQPDSINNGADDNASGVAGLLELAEAFGQPGAQPKRSLLFLAPGAEEPGLLGSAHYTENPTVPLERIVANINMDLIGRNWRDSVIAVGLEQSDLGQTLARVVQAHPDLHMTPIADRWPEERIFYRSDHYNFARKGVPILFFTSGTHSDYHKPSDEPDRIDGEKESRLVRLLFHLGTTIANQTSRPRWSAESYRQIVERR